MADQVFHATRDVPPEWTADLDLLCPGERVSRLVLHWLAGSQETPVQRWAVWEVLPRTLVGEVMDDERKRLGEDGGLTAALWTAVQGQDPRTLGHWAQRDGKKVWRSKSMVSREQWDIHKETDGLPFLSWIIEGDRGGHSWQFGPFEQHFLLAAGAGPDDVQAMQNAWPNPGSQPFAPYDRRVFLALAERDLLRQWRSSLSWEGRSTRTQAGLILDGEASARREDMMDRTMRWLDNQIGDAVSDIPRRMLPQWSEFQQTETAKDVDALHLHVMRDSVGKDYRMAQRIGD